jgi:hypothetical protein
MSDQVGGALLEMVLDLLGMDAIGEFDGYGDAGVATLVLALENGFTVRHSWSTNVIKFSAGNEQRISRNDTDRESYDGAAFLLNGSPRETRALLARYAAAGSRFLLGLPHEALALRDDASGTTVPVFADPMALTDWTRRGQRVVVAREDENGDTEFIDAVIQDVTADTIELDLAPGGVGVIGAVIMPAKAIYLEPQQDFERFESAVERWSIKARGASPLDFAPELASLDLSISGAAELTGITIVAREYGLVGNTFAFYLFHDAGAPAAGYLLEDLDTGEFGFTFVGGTTTVDDLVTAMAASSLGKLMGTYTGTDTIPMAAQFAPVALSGGSDQGDVGTGATVEEYEGHPVWDRELDLGAGITDGVQAMTQIIDKGGIPYALGTADQPDWFRSVLLTAGDQADWQWFKLFMSTLLGRQKKFWLATWREDLVYDSHAGDQLTIDADAGDFTAWWPQQREHVQVLQADDTVTYAEVTAQVDNGDGTRTLTLSETLGAAGVTKISWLELCRFENADTYTTQHGSHGFDVSLTARVVP